MKYRPIRPAGSDRPRPTGQGLPRSAEACRAVLDEAAAVELAGSDLPARWSGRTQFVVLDTHFGLGDKFLPTWQAWRDDAQRCERLIYVALDGRPQQPAELAQAHAHSPLAALAVAMQAAWPPLTANLHALDFEDGRVQLLLALGDPAARLPAMQCLADALFVEGDGDTEDPEGFALNLHGLKALGRKAAHGATLVSRIDTASIRHGLRTAGFDIEEPPVRDCGADSTSVPHLRARWAPRSSVRSGHPVRPAGPAAQARRAVVVGAGVAGAAAAQALARCGWQVTVLDRHAAPATEASGNPAGLFHGTLNADDGPYARLFRTAALQAQRDYGPLLAKQGGIRGAVSGLLRMDPQGSGVSNMRQLIDRLGLPPDYVQAVDAAQASHLSGLDLAADAWFYPGGGWLDPSWWVRQALAPPAIDLRCGVTVEGLTRVGNAADGTTWRLLGSDGTVVAETSTLVLACAASTPTLLSPWADSAWPLSATQGQVSLWPNPLPTAFAGLRTPLAGDGYAIPMANGSLLCGATRVPVAVESGAFASQPSADAHQANLQRLFRLCEVPAPDAGLRPVAELRGRCGIRLGTEDRLPIAGAMPLRGGLASGRADQARLLPREPGLFVLTALGARGITLAPLLGRLVAAQASGAPWLVEQDLADAVDPARWWVRAARQAGSAGQRAVTR